MRHVSKGHRSKRVCIGLYETMSQFCDLSFDLTSQSVIEEMGLVHCFNCVAEYGPRTRCASFHCPAGFVGLWLQTFVASLLCTFFWCNGMWRSATLCIALL